MADHEDNQGAELEHDTRRAGDDRNFTTEAVEFLSSQRNATLLHDFGEELDALVRAVRETGKGGTISLTIKAKPAGKNAGPSFVFSDTIKSNPPKPDVSETIMYASEDGSLTRRDPRQPGFPAFG